jgi:hypothetical protein
LALIGLCALASSVPHDSRLLYAVTHNRGLDDVPIAWPGPFLAALPSRSALLKVAHIRFEAGPSNNTTTLTNLKFDLYNQSAQTLTDILVHVSIVKRTRGGNGDPPTLIAGPYTIRGTADLPPGHTVEFEMGLRNLGPDCRCTARVAVLSARSVVRQ